MGQSESTINNAIPYDANSWRRLSREYLSSQNSLNNIDEREHYSMRTRNRDVSRSQTSLNHDAGGYRSHPSGGRWMSSDNVRTLPRTQSYSTLEERRQLDRDYTERTSEFHQTRQESESNIRGDATTNQSRMSQNNPRRTPSPFTHLSRFRASPSSDLPSYSIVETRKPRANQSEITNGFSRPNQLDVANNTFKGERTTLSGNYPTSKPPTQSVHHIPYRDYQSSSNQRLNQHHSSSRASLNSNMNRFAIPNRSAQPSLYSSSFPRYSRSNLGLNSSRTSPRIGFVKWIFILAILLNICSTIWEVVYMWYAAKKISFGFPIQGKLHSKSDQALLVWQIGLVVLLLFNNLVNILAIWATLVNRYWVLWFYVPLTFILGMFGSGSEMLRGSFTAWILPILCGLFAMIVVHRVAVITHNKRR